MAKVLKIAVIILAAGESSRMKQAKQLLPWGQSTLLGNAIKVGSESNAEQVYVVLGASAKTIQAQINTPDVEVILNKDWKKGMGSSISCAVDHLLNTPTNYGGIIIMLCDQPLIDADYLNKMIHIFSNEDKGIIATAYKRRNGVPVLFHKKYFKELTLVDGEMGAKELIAKNPNDVIAITPAGKEMDLDTYEEYQQAIKH